MSKKKVICIVLAVIILSGCVFGGLSVYKKVRTQKALELTADAYIYSLPLVLMDITADKITNTVEATATQAPINQFVHAQRLAGSDNKDVVLPNVDTIYTQSFLDLSETAVILELPKTDRFCIMQLLDAYSNTFGMIRCMDFANDRETYIITGPDYAGQIPEGMTEIKSPTAMVWVLGRTICAGNETDATNVHAIPRSMKIYTLNQYKNGTTDKPLTGEFHAEENVNPLEHLISMPLEEYFDRANQLMVLNPPTEADKDYVAKFAAIGVGPGLDFDTALFGDQADNVRLLILRDLVANCLEKSTRFHIQNGPWAYYGAPIGDYGTEYAFRALVALRGFGANPITMAVYPSADSDSEGNTLSGSNRYVIHLDADQIPQTDDHGFWSITAYGEDQYLIPNEMNRYCVNSQGDAIYNEDGSLDIYVSATAPEDEKLLANWLPVCDGTFTLFFRIYLPLESVLNGTWVMPDIAIAAQ